MSKAKATVELQRLRKQVKRELGQALQFIGRAANALRYDKRFDDSNTEAIRTEPRKAADALEQITASITEHIDNLLAR